MTVQTWYREPDFAPHYRRLWELEQELSDSGKALRFELASIWRLARDPDYAQWLKSLGTQTVQITFFGLEANTDYFTRRPGAFRDSLVATERLLAQGIFPRWQLFLTQHCLGELEEFVGLIQSLELDRRVEGLGGEFSVFVNTPAPEGEAFDIEHLRPTTKAIDIIPTYLKEKTVKHFNAPDIHTALGKAEAQWLKELRDRQEPYASMPQILAFMVTPSLEVYSNIGETRSWWSLGNLRTDGIDVIMQRFAGDAVPGLYAMFHIPIAQLAKRYGREDSPLLYTRSDLIRRWLHLWGEEYQRS